MIRRRSTFRRHPNRNRGAGTVTNNAVAWAYRAVASLCVTKYERDNLLSTWSSARQIGRNAPKPNPGETHRQLSDRLRAEAQPATPAKPKRVRAKKAAA